MASKGWLQEFIPAVHIIRTTSRTQLAVAKTPTGTKKAFVLHLKRYIDEEVRHELP